MPKAPTPDLLTLCAIAVALSTTGAHAVVTERVKDACSAEYYAHCSAYAVGSAALRSCMQSVQDQLSQGCLKELVAAGEVSQAEIRSYKARNQH